MFKTVQESNDDEVIDFQCLENVPISQNIKPFYQEEISLKIIKINLQKKIELIQNQIENLKLNCKFIDRERKMNFKNYLQEMEYVNQLRLQKVRKKEKELGVFLNNQIFQLIQRK